MRIPSPDLFYELLPAHYVSRISRRGIKIRGLWYDDPEVLGNYRGTASSRGGQHKGQWVIRRDPRDRRSVFFQDPVTHAWHALAWTGLPPDGQAPAFGDARVRDLLGKADACGLRPKTDADLLPVLLELIGAHIPVSRWPSQMGKAERTGHAREVAQAQAAQADRPAQPPAPEAAAREAAPGEASVTPLRRGQGWQQRAGQACDELDAERRRRREAAVPVAPKPPPRLGASYRDRNVFLLPEDDEEPRA